MSVITVRFSPRRIRLLINGRRDLFKERLRLQRNAGNASGSIWIESRQEKQEKRVTAPMFPVQNRLFCPSGGLVGLRSTEREKVRS